MNPIISTINAIKNLITLKPAKVTVTFIEAGVQNKVQYNYGSTVNRVTQPSSGSFVGWSKSSNGSNPVTSFIADSNITVWRVIKPDPNETVLTLRAKVEAGNSYTDYEDQIDSAVSNLSLNLSNYSSSIATISYQGTMTTGKPWNWRFTVEKDITGYDDEDGNWREEVGYKKSVNIGDNTPTASIELFAWQRCTLGHGSYTGSFNQYDTGHGIVTVTLSKKNVSNIVG